MGHVEAGQMSFLSCRQTNGVKAQKVHLEMTVKMVYNICLCMSLVQKSWIYSFRYCVMLIVDNACKLHSGIYFVVNSQM